VQMKPLHKFWVCEEGPRRLPPAKETPAIASGSTETKEGGVKKGKLMED